MGGWIRSVVKLARQDRVSGKRRSKFSEAFLHRLASAFLLVALRVLRVRPLWSATCRSDSAAVAQHDALSMRLVCPFACVEIKSRSQKQNRALVRGSTHTHFLFLLHACPETSPFS